MPETGRSGRTGSKFQFCSVTEQNADPLRTSRTAFWCGSYFERHYEKTGHASRFMWFWGGSLWHQYRKTFSVSQTLDGVRVNFGQAAKVVHLLAETMGIRAISLFTGHDQGTILGT